MDKNTEIIKSFKIQDNLNPKIWDTPDKLNSEIRETLLEIAYQFINFVKVDVFVDDIHLTGSLANFNWSKFSDFDVHLIVDYKQYPEDKVELYKELFDLKRMLFNTKQDIKIKGFEVEVYIQDLAEESEATGLYSILYDEWVTKPKKTSVNLNTERIRKKSQKWMNDIDTLIKTASKKDLDEAKSLLKKFREKLKKYRKTGLYDKEGEFSDENLVFKVLRRNGYIEKLFDFEDKLLDKSLSIDEIRMTN
jgi:predicted nucleotidyltransferase